MPRVLLIIFTVAVTIFAVSEIIMTKPEKFPSGQFPGGIPKAFWILVALLTAPLGGLAWIVISRVQLADESGVSLRDLLPRAGFKRSPKASSTPVAPDDDPEFLWQLEKELYQWRKAQQAEASDTTKVEEDGDADDDSPAASR